MKNKKKKEKICRSIGGSRTPFAAGFGADLINRVPIREQEHRFQTKGIKGRAIIPLQDSFYICVWAVPISISICELCGFDFACTSREKILVFCPTSRGGQKRREIIWGFVFKIACCICLAKLGYREVWTHTQILFILRTIMIWGGNP